MRVLIAEDDPQSQYMLATLMSGHGYEVITAKDGVEALDQLRRAPCDLLVADLLMPRLDGFQLCRAVKSEPNLCHIPIVVYTATYTAPEDEELARSAGADLFLIKPLDPDKILAAVEQLLRARKDSMPESQASSEGEPSAAGLVNELGHVQQHNERLMLKLSRKLEQLQQANLDLSERESRFRALAEAAPVGILRLDAAGRPEFWNEHWARLVGVPNDDTKHGWTSYVHVDDRARALHLWDEAVEAGHEGRAEVRLGGCNRPVSWALIQVKPLGSAFAKPQGFLIIVTDLTAEKKLELEKADLTARLHVAQKLEALGTLVGGMTHEINNLLTLILGFTELTRQSADLPDHVGSDLGYVIDAAKSGRDLTNQILTFASQQAEDFKPVNLAGIVRSVLSLLRPMVPATVELHAILPDQSPPISAADTQIRQLVINLVKNAFDAMARSGGTLAITVDALAVDAKLASTHPDLRLGDYVVLAVQDTGAGISPEVLPKIFDPFFTTKPVGKGTGLGLSVVHGIVQKHGGAIIVASEPNHGTTFRVFFPVARDLPAPAPSRDGATPGSGQHVLFIDDGLMQCRLAERLLQRLGYRVTTHTDPLAALEELRRQPGQFDLVFTDYMMPHLNGIELAALIAQVRADLPVVLMTGTLGAAKAPDGEFPAVAGILSKPFDSADLSQAAAKALAWAHQH